MLKLPEIITEDELKLLIKHTAKSHHKLAFALGFYECMRVSEVVKILPENVNKELRLLHIKQAKGSKDRMIPIAPEILKALKFLPIGCGARALQIAFKIKAKAILNKDLHFHSLRHSGCTHYLTVKHWSTREVQRMAGHSKVSTTEIYLHVSPQNLVDRMWDQ